jgi:hypothetical protein
MLWNISFCRSPRSVQYMFCKKSLQIVTPIGSGQSCPPLTAFCSCDWSNYFKPSYRIKKIFPPHYFRIHLYQFSQPEEVSTILKMSEYLTTTRCRNSQADHHLNVAYIFHNCLFIHITSKVR